MDRKNLQENSHPSIMEIKINDHNSQVTCLEISQNGNVILCGNNDGSILLYKSNFKFKTGYEMDEEKSFIEKNEDFSEDEDI